MDNLLYNSNERPFQCTKCKKSYKTSSTSDSHIERKTFEVKANLTGIIFFFIFWLPYISIRCLNNMIINFLQCKLCDKKLQSRTSYRNHMKRHTEDKKHECEHCSKRFFTRYHLKLHQSKIHKGLAENSNDADLVKLIEDGTMIVFE